MFSWELLFVIDSTSSPLQVRNVELDAEVAHRVQRGWKNWKRVSGVLCDRRMNVKINGKMYMTMVTPELAYEAETLALKKAQEKKLDVAEMQMQ